MESAFENKSVKIIIATHSTALLHSLSNPENLRVGFIQPEQKEVKFESTNEIYKSILPIFGAHPLSNVFNDSPIFLVEGEDDLRIWQQAIRTSEGRINIYPCSVGSIYKMNKYEKLSRKILSTVYDNAIGYSLRDNDEDIDEFIENLGCIKRFRLSCREAENLLLTDEVLASLETSWDELRREILNWLEKNKNHPHHKQMYEFKDNDFCRKSSDIKSIRNDLMGIIGSNKPWEIAIGQTIGNGKFNNSKNSIKNYLGGELVSTIVKNPGA